VIQNQPQRPENAVSLMELYDLGLSRDNFQVFNTLEDLKGNPPNIVIAECVFTIRFVQNKFHQEQQLNKKQNYVMAAGVYTQLRYDPRIRIEILRPAKMQFKKIYRHYNGQNLDNKTLLITRQGGIGDLLFIQPNLVYLKEKYPTCTIKFACGPQYQSMIKEWDCADEILDLPFNVSELFQSDYHVVFEGVIERCKEAETTCSYNLFSKWMGLNLPDELLLPKQKPNEEDIIEAKNALKELNINEKDFILLQMRASSPVRSPNPDIWKKLIDLLTDKGHNILITDAPQHEHSIIDFIKRVKDPDKVKSFCKYSKTISDTIAATSLSKMVIGTDSSLVHIAESLGIKSFAIMGPFPGRVRYSTYKNCDWVDVVMEGCSPCFQHGTKPCKNASILTGSSRCYQNLDYDLCIEKIERLLNV
jgi:ADP-heptose:LPS heptosyltransferase